jgi:hypothetical protein
MTTANEKRTTIRLGLETTWSEPLRDAVSTPGKLLEAYTAFHTFSVGNSLLALFQCYHKFCCPSASRTGFPTDFHRIESVSPEELFFVLYLVELNNFFLTFFFSRFLC